MAFSDPHAAWEAERQALRPLFAEFEDLQADQMPEDMDDQVYALCEADNGLIGNITSTTPKTIEGALAVIESLDHYNRFSLGAEDPWTLKAIEVRERAVATIRRRLADLEG